MKILPFLVIISYNNLNILGFRDFRDANVSIKSVDSVSVLWRPRDDRSGHSPLKSDPD
jgi:hypothetical protein